MKSTHSKSVPDFLVTAIVRLLKPLVHLLISHQVTLPYFTDLLKQINVEVAEQYFQVPGKRQTDSRIHLLTGVHRKDVRRLRNEPFKESDVPQAVSLGGKIIARWTSDPRYSDSKGNPRPLPRRHPKGGGPSFEELAEEISHGDVRSRAPLDELVRLGVAEIIGELIHLKMDAFVPSEGTEEKWYYFGRNIRDHIDAASHNILSEGRPMFDRSVYYSGLTLKSIDKLEALCGKVGMTALQEVNRRAAQLKKKDEGEKGARHRMNFGAFFFRDSTGTKPDTDSDDPSSTS